MRVNVSINIEFDGSTISAADAEQRARVLFQRALDDGHDILTDEGAVIDGASVSVLVVP